MAKISLENLPQAIKSNEKLSAGLNKQIKKMLWAGGEIVTERTGERLNAMTVGYDRKYKPGPNAKERRTGALKESLKAGNLQMDMSGMSSIDVWPHGNRTDDSHKTPTRNATIGFVLEYGRTGLPARPFMAAGEEASQADVIEQWGRMMDVYVATGGK